MLYPWKFGHAPLSGTSAYTEANNCLWWHERASGSNQQISVNAAINEERDNYRLANDFRSCNATKLRADLFSNIASIGRFNFI